MNIKGLFWRVWFAAICVMGGLSQAQVTIEEHWSPYDYPRVVAEGAKFHIIVKGDTLWHIAEQYFADPLLWPQIYQANPYIKDPDLIYPGDPVILEIGVVVTAETVGQSEGATGDGTLPEDMGTDELAELTEFTEDQPEGEDVQVRDREQTTSLLGSGTQLVIIPAGDRSDIECSTYILPMESKKDDLPYDFTIVGGEDEKKLSFAIDDVVYLNKGTREGVAAGDVYSIRRRVDNVFDPSDNSFVGVAIDQIGRLRVLVAQEFGATAVVTHCCDGVLKGDFLVPYEQEPIPLITELPPFDRWAPFEKDAWGSIVFSEDRVAAMGVGFIANINLGILDNVAPGDIFIIYRPNPNNNERKGVLLPDIYLGQGVALKSSENTSVMRIIQGVDTIHVGDRVVLYQD